MKGTWQHIKAKWGAIYGEFKKIFDYMNGTC